MSRVFACLGVDAVAGSRIWDVQGNFRVVVGPVDAAGMRTLMPDRPGLRKLVDLVRAYAGADLGFDVQVVLRAECVPQLQMPGSPMPGLQMPGMDAGQAADPPRLGWNTWAKSLPALADKDDIILDPDLVMAPGRGPCPAFLPPYRLAGSPMKLILRLVDANAPAQSRSLDSGTLSIGRGTENDWVLADPDRTLSKNHCRIDASDGGFMLTDLSTNGVFLAGSQQAVGRGHSVVLEDGDSFSMGPYRMLAEIEDGRFGSPDMDAMVGPSGNRSPLIPQVEEPWLTGLPSGDFGPGRRAAPHGWDAPPDPRGLCSHPDCSNRRAATGRSLTMPWARRLDCSANSPSIFPPPRRTCACPRPRWCCRPDWMDSDPLEPAEVACCRLLRGRRSYPTKDLRSSRRRVPPADWLLPVVTIPDAAPVLEPALPEVPIAEAPVPDAEAAVEPAPAVAETVVSSLPLLQAPAPIHEPVVPRGAPCVGARCGIARRGRAGGSSSFRGSAVSRTRCGIPGRCWSATRHAGGSRRGVCVQGNRPDGPRCRGRRARHHEHARAG